MRLIDFSYQSNVFLVIQRSTNAPTLKDYTDVIEIFYGQTFIPLTTMIDCKYLTSVIKEKEGDFSNDMI